MPDLKISQLPPASTPLAGTELVPIVQGGVTDQTTVQAILTGTVPSGTANGVLYLNGSKVVTSGSGLTFDGVTLGVEGSSGVSIKNISTATQANLRLGSSFTAGTAGANTDWSVIQSFSAYGDLVFRSGTSEGNDPRTAGSTRFQFLRDGTAIWSVGGSEQMRLTSTGLGIGTNNPQAKLQVTGSGKGSIFGSGSAVNFYSAWQYNSTDVGYVGNGASIVAGAASTDFGLTAFTSGKLWLGSNNGASYAVLDASGNLGLGVTPSAWSGVYAGALQVGRAVMHTNTGDFRASFGNNYYVDGTNARYIGDGFATQLMQVSGEYRFFNAPNNTSGAGAGPISFTQAMTLDASGNLLVGATSTTIPTASGSLIYLNSPGSLYVGHANGAASGTIYSAFAYNGSVIGSITQDGTTAVLYNTTSDQRLKENITDADPASNLIDAIQIRQFDWKSDGSHQRYGMVAQELAHVAPEAVHQPADPEEMMAVDYSKLVPMLIKEIQSLRARVAAIEA